MESISAPRRESSESLPLESSIEHNEELKEQALEILKNFDYKTLQEIFKEDRNKSGVNTDETAFFTPHNKINFTDNPVNGSYEEKDGSIIINPDAIEKQKKAGVSFENNLISVLIHEETHSSGRNSENLIPTNALGELVTSLRSRLIPKDLFLGGTGYQYSDAHKGEIRKTQYNFFNEAVTDSIAEEAYDKYITRTGTRPGGESSFIPAYLPQRALLEVFLNSVAQSTETTRDVVWNSIKQGYYAGLNLSDSEMGSLYEEFALTELMGRVRNVHSVEEIPSIIEQLPLQTELSPESKERVEVGMKELQTLLNSYLKENDSEGGDYRDERRIAKYKSINESIDAITGKSSGNTD